MTCDGEKMTISCDSFLKGEWKQFKLPKEAVLVPWKDHQVINSVEWHCYLIKSHLFKRMMGQKQVGVESIAIYRPKHAKTIKSVGKDKLVFQCLSPKVALVPDGKEGSGLVIGKTKCGDCVFSVVLGDPTAFPKEDGHKTEAAVSPFWAVGITHDEEEANMVMKDHRPDQTINSPAAIEKMALPFLKNPSSIEEDQKLLYFKPEQQMAVEPLKKHRRTG